MPLRVLITNRVLTGRTGTELYVRDLAISLLQRGHHPIVYSPQLGEVAAEIRRATVPVVNDLSRIGGAPDVIHGHHGLETLAALMAFPGVPAVAFCHGWIGWPDAPIRFPRILRHVAVDHTCRDRLLFEHAIPEKRIYVALNSVDLNRFRPRGPLPRRPESALVFSNAASGHGSHLAAVREACAKARIRVDVVGFKSGNLVARPEDVLGRYDLVFAKGRAALEAMAVGSAVVLCDVAGAGPMVTTHNLSRLRPLNFGMRALQDHATPEILGREIERYDAADAMAVSAEVRKSAGHDALVNELIALYVEVIAEQRERIDDPAAEQSAAAVYLEWLAPRLHQRDLLKIAFARCLRVPLLSTLIRARARREGRGHWLPQLLASMDHD